MAWIWLGVTKWLSGFPALCTEQRAIEMRSRFLELLDEAFSGRQLALVSTDRGFKVGHELAVDEQLPLYKKEF